MSKRINLDEDPRNQNWLHELRVKYDQRYYTFLDGLRETGVTNMFEATPYLLNQFHELDESLAKKILKNWMETFHRRHPKRSRGHERV